MQTIKELWLYREMIISLTKRDLKARYKGTVLGFLWMLINPLFQLAIYTIVFSFIMRSGIEHFYLFLFVALIPWIFFNTCFSSGTRVIFNHQDMVKKIYFPREALVIAFVTSQFVNMLLSFVVIFLIFGFSSVGLHLVPILFLPIVMLSEYMLALGFAFITSAITVYFRDAEQIFGIMTMAWMYMTPILYDITMVPERLTPIFHINPLTSIIVSYRDIFYYGQIPDSADIMQSLVAGIIMLLIGHLVFMKLQKGFAEEL